MVNPVKMTWTVVNVKDMCVTGMIITTILTIGLGIMVSDVYVEMVMTTMGLAAKKVWRLRNVNFHFSISDGIPR